VCTFRDPNARIISQSSLGPLAAAIVVECNRGYVSHLTGVLCEL
jgi:hypothetical protein